MFRVVGFERKSIESSWHASELIQPLFSRTSLRFVLTRNKLPFISLSMRKTMMNIKLLSGVLVLALSMQAQAESPSFNFVELGYVSSFGAPVDFDGWEIKGNLEITDSIYMNAGYGNVDVDLITLGLGYKTNISDTSTLFAEIDYLRVDNSFSGFGSTDGYQVGFGIRSNTWSRVELKAAAYYRDINGSDSFLQFGTAYRFTDSAGVYLDIESDFDDSAYSLGVRFMFN